MLWMFVWETICKLLSISEIISNCSIPSEKWYDQTSKVLIFIPLIFQFHPFHHSHSILFLFRNNYPDPCYHNTTWVTTLYNVMLSCDWLGLSLEKMKKEKIFHHDIHQKNFVQICNFNHPILDSFPIYPILDGIHPFCDNHTMTHCHQCINKNFEDLNREEIFRMTKLHICRITLEVSAKMKLQKNCTKPEITLYLWITSTNFHSVFTTIYISVAHMWHISIEWDSIMHRGGNYKKQWKSSKSEDF